MRRRSSPFLTSTAHRSPARTAWSKAALVAVVVAMVLAQMLGLAHRVLHADPGPRDPAHASAGLFGDHSDSAQCRLYDQVAHGDVAFGSLLLPLVDGAPVPTVATHPTWHLAAQAAGFLARGPPIPT